MAFGTGDAIESIFVELGLDPQKFFTGVDSAVTQGAQKAEQFGQKSSAVMGKIAAVAAIAGAAVAGIFSIQKIKDAVNYTEEYAASVRKLARETGMTVEQSSEMLFTAQRVGMEVDGLSGSLGILAKKLKGVQDEETGVTTGGKSTAQILADIGVQATDSEGNLRPFADLIPEIADVFAKMPDGIEKTGLAMQLFGRSGKDMLPLLNLGSEGMAELAAEANKLGLVLSAENAAKIKQYTLAQRGFTQAMGGLKLMVGTALIPLLTKGLNLLISWQPAIRQGLGKSIQWLTSVFIGLWTYLKHVVKTGDTLDDYLKGARTPLSLFFLLLGQTVVNLKSIAEWLLKAADTVLEWGRNVAAMLSGGQDAADNFNKLGDVIPIVAKALAALVAAMVIGTVLGFAAAIGGLAANIITFPLGVLWDVISGVGELVSTAAKLVSKAVTITQNVVSTGTEIIRSLPWVYGEVEQLVRRTGAKIIDKLNPITGTVTQSVEITPPADAGEKAQGWFAALMANVLGGLGGSPEVLKAIGLFASGMIAGIGASLGSGISISAIAAAIASAVAAGAAAVGAVLVAISPVGWVIIAAVVVALILTALAIIFREKVGPFFKDTLPRLFTEALPQFAKALPGWAAELAGMIAGAVVFALLGIPALLITRVAPAIGEAIIGIFKKVPWGKLGGAFASLGGLIGGWIGGAFKAIGGLLADVGGDILKFATSVPGWISGAVKAIPGLFIDALKAIPGLFIDLGVAILKFATSVPGWIAEAFAALPGILAGAARGLLEFAQNIPKWIAEAFGKIPDIVSGALEGAAGLVGIVARALGAAIEAIRTMPLAQAVSDQMGYLWQRFLEGWNRIDELTGGALNDLVSGIAGLAGRLLGFVGSLFSAASDLGGAIFDGIMTGLKAIPSALGDLASAIKGVFVAAINGAIGVVNALIPDSIPLGFTVGGRFIGKNIDIPDNPIPLVSFGGGGIVPGPTGAPVLAIVHGGEHVTPAGQTAPTFHFNMPLSMTGYDLEGMRRLIHAEIDEAFNGAARRAYLAGAPLTGGIG